jgi:hypothetical protein
MLRNAAASMVAKLVASLKSMLSVIEHPKKELDNTSVTVESTIMCGMQGHKGNELFVHEPPMKYDDSLRTKVVDPVASVDRHDAEARAQRSAAVHGARKEESIVRSEIRHSSSNFVTCVHIHYPVFIFFLVDQNKSFF